MALKHLQSGQVADVHAHGATLAQQKTVALFKARNLEVIRLVLQAQQAMPPHKVAGDITIHCLEGRLQIGLPSGPVALLPGQLVFLDGQLPHSVLALEPSSALVTIALTANPTANTTHTTA